MYFFVKKCGLYSMENEVQTDVNRTIFILDKTGGLYVSL